MREFMKAETWMGAWGNTLQNAAWTNILRAQERAIAEQDSNKPKALSTRIFVVGLNWSNQFNKAEITQLIDSECIVPTAPIEQPVMVRATVLNGE